MLRIIILGFIYFALGIYVNAQSSKPRILYNSSEINSSTNQDTLFIKNIYLSFWSDSVVVKLRNKKKLSFSVEKVWGYEDKFGNFIRFYNGSEFQLTKVDSIVFYTQKRGKYTHYFFSKSLDSEIFPLTKKNIRQQFYNNLCFLDMIDKNLKWYQDVNTFSKKNGTFLIVEYYLLCKNK